MTEIEEIRQMVKDMMKLMDQMVDNHSALMDRIECLEGVPRIKQAGSLSYVN